MDYVHVTHFLNPHLFFYRKVDSDYTAILDLEMEIGHFAAMATPLNSGKSFKTGETVAVFLHEMNKWVRGRVDACHVLDCYSATKYSYCVFALDYGFPIIAQNEEMIALPNKYKALDSPIFIGGLANCVPIVMQFNLKKFAVDIHITPDWTPKALAEASELITNATMIRFQELKSLHFADYTHKFGHLFLTNVNGNACDLHDVLVEMNCATISAETVPPSAQTTVKAPVWKDRFGFLLDSRVNLKPKMGFDETEDN